MSEYQVIARKYRPQCFADVAGQEHVVRTLRNAIISNRIANAYLFVGPRGVGKTTLARIFAKAMNCEHPVDGEPCCKCGSCLSIADDSALDLIEIDAASHNSAGEMRELNEEAMHAPVSGKYKIYIIDEVHMLSKQAWNALLKTIEEPPAHVKFIFATTEVHQVLPTIISRCQRFDLLPIPAKIIAERLKYIVENEHVAIEDGAIGAVARAADGGMRDAQSLLDQLIAFFGGGDSQISTEQVLSLFGLTDTADLTALLEAMFGNRPGDAVRLVHKSAAKGRNLETLYDDVLGALRSVEMCLLLDNPAEVLDCDGDQLELYRRFAQSVKLSSVQIMLETMASAGRILHDALNKQIFLESIMLRAMREAHAVRLDDVLAQLNRLRSAGELEFLKKIPAETAVEPVLPEQKKNPEVTSAETSGGELPSSAAEKPAEALHVAENEELPAESMSDVQPGNAESVAAEEVADINGGSQIVEVPAVHEDVVPEQGIADKDVASVNNSAPSGGDEGVVTEEASGRIGRMRQSIIERCPEAISEAADDPYVRETLNLFGGKIIDIHQ